MPTFVQSAMNPNGTWQADAMDQSEQANRQAAFQAAQMQNEIAARQLQAHLEQMHMNQQGTQFEEGRADQLGMHNSTLENENRMQQAGFGHEDNAALARAGVEKAIADMQFGPNSLAARKYQQEHDDDIALQNRIFGGSVAAQPAVGGGPSVPAPDMAAMHQMPADMAHNPMAGYGGGAMPAPVHAAATSGAPAPGGVDPDMLKRVAIYSALHNHTALPDFAAQDDTHRLLDLKTQQAVRDDAGSRIQSALDSGDIEGAKRLAAESGAQMPRIDSAAVASRPDVQLSLSAVDRARDEASKAYASDKEVAALKLSMAQAIASLTNHGVNPAEADALVKQRVLQGIPSRYGTMGGIASDMGYLMLQPEIFGDTSKSDRVNQIHDLIGQ